MTTPSQRAMILYRPRRFINCLLTYLLLFLVCVSWTITGQPRNSVFICKSPFPSAGTAVSLFRPPHWSECSLNVATTCFSGKAQLRASFLLQWRYSCLAFLNYRGPYVYLCTCSSNSSTAAVSTMPSTCPVAITHRICLQTRTCGLPLIPTHTTRRITHQVLLECMTMVQATDGCPT